MRRNSCPAWSIFGGESKKNRITHLSSALHSTLMTGVLLLKRTLGAAVLEVNTGGALHTGVDVIFPSGRPGLFRNCNQGKETPLRNTSAHQS